MTDTTQALLIADPRGLLAIDVDGPLNPYANKPYRRPPGFKSYRLTRDGRFLTGRDFRRHKGMFVWLHPDHGRQIHDLARETRLQPVWATTWLHDANRLIGPAIGLPELPVITFSEDSLSAPPWPQWRLDGPWKYPDVAAYAGNLPIAWLDDEHDLSLAADGISVLPHPTRRAFLDARAAARDRFLRDRATTHTLLCQVNPSTGITAQHHEQIRTWAATLPPGP